MGVRVGTSAAQTILVLDPSCRSAHGHHAKSLDDLIAALAPRKPVLMVNAALPHDVFPPAMGIEVHRVFKTTVYDEPGLGPRPNDRIARRTWKLRRHVRALADESRRKWTRLLASSSPGASLAAEDWDWARWRAKWPELATEIARIATAPIHHVIAPSSDIELICGLAEQRQHISALAGAHIHARVITVTPAMARLRAHAGASAAYRALLDKRMAGVHLYVETAAMQRHVLETYGLNSDVYPYLLAPPPFVEPAPRPGQKRAVFGYFGAMRNEKGFPRLLPILRELASTRRLSDPALAFVIHASDADDGEAAVLRNNFGALEGPGLEIELITGALSEAEYARRFAGIDATLLPYTGKRYALSGSGIVCEALAQGKAIVMSKGLSFAESCTPGNALEAGTDAEFAAAILTMARDIERFRKGASTRALSYAGEVKACALLKRLA